MAIEALAGTTGHSPRTGWEFADCGYEIGLLGLKFSRGLYMVWV